MEITLLVQNAILGFTCMALMLRNLRFRAAISEARARARTPPRTH
jgi:hypothetical protein